MASYFPYYVKLPEGKCLFHIYETFVCRPILFCISHMACGSLSPRCFFGQGSVLGVLGPRSCGPESSESQGRVDPLIADVDCLYPLGFFGGVYKQSALPFTCISYIGDQHLISLFVPWFYLVLHPRNRMLAGSPQLTYYDSWSIYLLAVPTLAL